MDESGQKKKKKSSASVAGEGEQQYLWRSFLKVEAQRLLVVLPVMCSM